MRPPRRRARATTRRRRPPRGEDRAAADLPGRRGPLRPQRARRDGARLVVSQFTLLADTAKGNRPCSPAPRRRRRRSRSTTGSARRSRRDGVQVERGVFGAAMGVELVNDGPVTIVLERIGLLVMIVPVKLLVTGGAGYPRLRGLPAGGSRAADEVLATQHERPPPHGRPLRLDVRDDEAVAALPHATRPGGRRPHGVRAERAGARRDDRPRQPPSRRRAPLRRAARPPLDRPRLRRRAGGAVRRGRQSRGRSRTTAPRSSRRSGSCCARIRRRSSSARRSSTASPSRAAGGARARDDVEFYTDEIRCPTRRRRARGRAPRARGAERRRARSTSPRPDAVSRLELAALPAGARRARPGRRPGRAAPRRGRARNVALDSSRAAGLARETARGIRGDRPFGLSLATLGLPFSPVRRNGPGGPIFFDSDGSTRWPRHTRRKSSCESEIAPRVEHELPGVEVLAVELATPDRFVVYVDHPEGVDHALCERVTDLLRDYLREYTVDVSSPGIERPLRTPPHFAGVVGTQGRAAHGRAGRRPLEVQGRSEGRRHRRADARASTAPTWTFRTRRSCGAT